MAKTVTELKADERERKKDLGLIRRDVWARPEDWPRIRELETDLIRKRFPRYRRFFRWWE